MRKFKKTEILLAGIISDTKTSHLRLISLISHININVHILKKSFILNFKADKGFFQMKFFDINGGKIKFSNSIHQNYNQHFLMFEK